MKHIPNILTSFRIVLIPFFIWQMLAGNTITAGVILLVSALTDTLDGNLARHFGWVTDVGKALDPLADKLTQTTVSICLMIRYPRLWFLFAILIAKELVMVVMGLYLHRGGVHIDGAKWFGKVATVVFYVVMGVLVFFPEISPATCTALVILVVLCAVIAGLMYLPDYRRYKQERAHKASE